MSTPHNAPLPPSVTRPALALTGTVHCGSRPVDGVVVTLADRAGVQVGRGHTGPDGRFHVTGLVDGSYLAIFSRIGYQPYAAMVTLDHGSAPLEVTLDPASSVHGLVRDRHTGRPVAAATVTAVGPGGDVIDSTVSEPDGRYRVTGIDADTITLVVAAPAADPFAIVVECGTGADHEVDLALETYSALTGTVTAAGEPVAGLLLTLREPDGVVAATALTDRRGTYRFDRIKAGQYTVDSATRSPQAFAIASDVTTACVALAPAQDGRQASG
jgi:hypothetical protein